MKWQEYDKWLAEQKEWIDKASYYELLKKWRFAPIGDRIFQGELGNYYSDVMAAKRDRCPDPVMVSKLVGWGDQQVVEDITMEAPTTPLPPATPELQETLDRIKKHFSK